MLRIDLRPGESVQVGDAVITLEHKKGSGARLSIDADRSVPIKRLKTSSLAQIAGSFGILGKPKAA